MTDNGEVTSTCDQCGASIYEQHLESGIAKRKDGKLFCSHCVAELTEAQGGDDDVSDDLAPIEFEDDNESSTVEMTSSRIHKGAETAPGAGGWDDERFKRPLDPKTSAASRCRTFHCRISQGAVDFLNEQVNDWNARRWAVETGSLAKACTLTHRSPAVWDGAPFGSAATT